MRQIFEAIGMSWFLYGAGLGVVWGGYALARWTARLARRFGGGR